MTLLSKLRAGATDALEVTPNETRRLRGGGYWLLNVGGWLFFGAAVMIGWLEQYPWDVILTITPVYILIGFLLSLLLAPALNSRYMRSFSSTSRAVKRDSTL